MVTAIILSAGLGTRLGGDMPKQYIEVAGMPVLAHCLKSFERSSADNCIIVCGAGDEEYVRDKITDSFGLTKITGIVAGGSERYFSVLEGLREAAKYDCSYCLIHDGARPYITPSGIDLMIDQVKIYDAAVAAMPVKDTVRITDSQGFVTATTVRKLTWQVQTPQCFRFDLIRDAYEEVVGQEGADLTGITDDAMIFERAYPDRKIKLVDLHEENSKVTTKDDLEYMRYRLS